MNQISIGVMGSSSTWAVSIHIILKADGGVIWKTTTLSNIPELLLICYAMVAIALQNV